jgi:hypothetical protein
MIYSGNVRRAEGRSEHNPEQVPLQFHLRLMRRTQMRENEIQPYTVEELQQKYAVSLHVAVEVLEHFRGDRSKIDKFMKRCPNRDDDDRQ